MPVSFLERNVNAGFSVRPCSAMAARAVPWSAAVRNLLQPTFSWALHQATGGAGWREEAQRNPAAGRA